jgi:mono/diheme cytochrome c family protein
MRRGAIWLTLVLTALIVIGVQAQAEGDADRGAQLYLENCAVCHGEDGQGRIGASLEGFPGIQVDEVMSQTISKGIEGSVMPAWGSAFGGPLTEQDVTDIVTYVTGVFDGTEPIAPWRDRLPAQLRCLPR